MAEPLFPSSDHDHATCAAAALAEAEAICARHGARLTPKRRAVLSLLLEDHVPLGAYEIAERVAWGERRPASVAIYRVLAFLENLGLVHRIESLNAYLACGQPLSRHGAQFLVCTGCRRVAEASDAPTERAVGRLAGRFGFAVQAPVIEIKGLCPGCASAEAAGGDD